MYEVRDYKNAEYKAMVTLWTVDTFDLLGASEVRLRLYRNERYREVVVRDGVVHVYDLHPATRDVIVRVMRTWHTFEEAVLNHPHPLQEGAPLALGPQVLGVRCSVTGETLWVRLGALRSYMVEKERDLPLSPEGCQEALARLCARRGQGTVQSRTASPVSPAATSVSPVLLGGMTQERPG